MMMSVGIIGPGAMGSLFAATLAKGGLVVNLVDHREDRARKLNQAGLNVRGIRGEYTVQLPITCDSRSVGHVDLVMVCVKAHQTRTAMQNHLSLVGPNTMVWTIQNGLGNTDTLKEIVGEDRVLGGLTTLGAFTPEDGVVCHAAEGETFIGELSGESSPRLEKIVRAFEACGFSIKAVSDIHRRIWKKILVNVGINPLTAILNIKNGELLEHEACIRIMNAAILEAVWVANQKGHAFDPQEICRHVREVAKKTRNNRSSMLCDISAGRPTEIDYINGAVCSLGNAPVNQTLTDLVKALESRATPKKHLPPTQGPLLD